MTDWFVYASALSLGFLGGGHCVGMCGGIMGALTFAIPDEARGKRFALLVHYNFGRIASYSLMGLLLGLATGKAADVGGASGLQWLRLFAGGLLIAMGLYLADWWRGLTYLEKLGGGLWKILQPLGRSLMPVRASWQALLLGGIWGWLPCGLVYSALAYAASQGDALSSAGVMLAFGLGTLPLVMTGGLFADRLKFFIQKRGVRTLFALLIVAFGIWTLWGGLQHAGHADHAGHGTTGQEGVIGEPMDHSHHHHQ